MQIGAVKNTYAILFLMIVHFRAVAQVLPAAEPVAQASNLTFSTLKSYRIIVQFTPASPAPDGYIVLRRTGAAITDVPVDGNTYVRGDMIGQSKVVSCGNTHTFMPNNIVANTNYFFAVFSYNGSGAQRNYLTSAPLTANVMSLGSMQPSNYYTAVSISSASLVSDLHNKTNPHTKQTYNNYGTKFILPFIARDTSGDRRVVSCVYSGENVIYSEPWAWTANGFSREHTYAQSWMPTVNESGFTSMPEYSDYHQLFPVNQNNANLLRSNYPLGEVVHVTSTYLGCKFGTNAWGKQVFEPRDAHKGDAARALMYQAICYTGVNGFNWKFPDPISNTIPYGQDQTVLKKWHYQDPPDNYEIARNDFLDSLQNNRNPFIDEPLYACYINFNNMTYIASPDIPCNLLGTLENKKYEESIVLAPNPSNGQFIINFTAVKSQNITIKIFDLMCHVVYCNEQRGHNGKNSVGINAQNLKSGIYILELDLDGGKQTKKLIIE